MAPPLESYPANQLPDRTQGNVKDRKRKGFNGDLKACELLEMLQYECKVEPPVTKESFVQCWPVVRLFRQCKDREGSFMVETTAWEGEGKKVG